MSTPSSTRQLAKVVNITQQSTGIALHVNANALTTGGILFVSVRLHCFVETLDGCNWTAVKNGRNTRLKKVLSQVVTPMLQGVLAMGMGGRSFPFSFGARGAPPVMSHEIKKVMADNLHRIKGISHLTRAELEHKAVELLISPHESALSVRKKLNDFIKFIPVWEGDPEHQRIVFWFDARNR